MTDRETSIVDDGHLYRKIGGRWTHDSSTCCPATEWTHECETPTTWTHKCSYLSHSDSKVTLTDSSLNCFFCGTQKPGKKEEISRG